MSDKLKKWSVLSYVAAVLHAIVLVLLVIEWHGKQMHFGLFQISSGGF